MEQWTNKRDVWFYSNRLKTKPTFDANDGGTEITLKSLEQEIIKQNQENTVSGQLSLTFESVGPLLIAGVNQNDESDRIDLNTPFIENEKSSSMPRR